MYDCSNKPLRMSTPMINRKTCPSPFCPLPLCLLEPSILLHGSFTNSPIFSATNQKLCQSLNWPQTARLRWLKLVHAGLSWGTGNLDIGSRDFHYGVLWFGGFCFSTSHKCSFGLRSFMIGAKFKASES